MINRTQNKDYNLKMYLKEKRETNEVQRTFYKCKENDKMEKRTSDKDYNLKMYLKRKTQTKWIHRTFYKCRD